MQPITPTREVASISGPYVLRDGRWCNAYGGAIRANANGTYTVRWLDAEGGRTSPSFDALVEAREHFYAAADTARLAVATAAFEVVNA